MEPANAVLMSGLVSWVFGAMNQELESHLAVMIKSRLGFVFQGQPGDQAALFAAQARPSPQLPQYPGLQQAQVPMFAL